MKVEEYVERIRLKVENAVKNTLDRCGVTAEGNNYIANNDAEIGNIEQLIGALILEKRDWKDCYDELVDDYAFTLFNRMICMKVLETHGLYPPMITQEQQYAGKAYGHYMWLEHNNQYRDDTFEGLDKYIKWQFEQLAKECDLFNTSIPLHMIPTSTFLQEIIDIINAVDEDEQIDKDIWKQGNILSQIYEIYNNSKKAALKASGDKVEYDKVHVQSQIYTPEWVVKFLVDNSLGKMYLEMYPDSIIKDSYKIIGDFSNPTREVKPLDEIKVIDPCVGSGNFLLYCFDLFYDLYMDQIDYYGADYSRREVPQIIIERNLHGIDLDERAVQLTKVGLFIKAKAKKNSVHISHFNVASANFRLPQFDEVGTLFDSKFFSKEFSELLSDVWNDLQQAHKFGSLLRIDEKFEEKKKKLKESLGQDYPLFTYEREIELDLFENNFYERLEEAIAKYAVNDKKRFFADEASMALTFLKIIIDKYEVVVSNPPFTKNADFGEEINDFINKNYKIPLNFVGNLYSAFYKRNFDSLRQGGYLAMIHPLTFMYISTFSDMRKHILYSGQIHLFVEYGLSDLFGKTMVDPAFYVVKKQKNSNIESYFVSLDQYTRTPEEKNKKRYCLEALDNILKGEKDINLIKVNQNDLLKIKGYPFTYNISEEFRNKFQADTLETYMKICVGLQTGCNERFIRLWWEVNPNKAFKSDKWFKYDKGGDYCKWYGNNWAVVNWENNGIEIKNLKSENGKQKSRPQNEKYYKKIGITYTASGTKGVTFRVHEDNSLFDVGGSCIFPTGKYDNLSYIIAFMNSRLSFYLIDCINPTVNTQVGNLKIVPFVKPSNYEEKQISLLAEQCINIKRRIDSKYLLNGAKYSPLNITTSLFESIYDVVSEEAKDYVWILINELLIDKVINRIYELDIADINRMTEKMGVCVASISVYSKAVEAFGMEINPNELNQNLLKDIQIVDYDEEHLIEIRSKISSSLFSNNNEIEDFCKNNNLNPITVWYFIKYEKVIPQAKAREFVFEWIVFALRDILTANQDGMIALTSTDTPIVQLLEEYADRKGITSAQLLQMEEFLGKRIKDFIEKDFFNELMNYTNVFMYLPKTPFIWHLSSGDNRGFEALIIIYKWNGDSLYKLKTNYISKRREKLEFRNTQLVSSDTAQALEEKDLINKQLKEIESFIKKIDELIAEGYNPILDDGVGKNIAPLQHKKMLKADVLNANQLKKYLKAEW